MDFRLTGVQHPHVSENTDSSRMTCVPSELQLFSSELILGLKPKAINRRRFSAQDERETFSQFCHALRTAGCPIDSVARRNCPIRDDPITQKSHLLLGTVVVGFRSTCWRFEFVVRKTMIFIAKSFVPPPQKVPP